MEIPNKDSERDTSNTTVKMCVNNQKVVRKFK